MFMRMLMLMDIPFTRFIGDEGGLALSVGVYSVDHVECFANRPFNDDGKCSTLVNTLQISPRRFLWLRRPGGQKLGDGEFLLLLNGDLRLRTTLPFASVVPAADFLGRRFSWMYRNSVPGCNGSARFSA